MVWATTGCEQLQQILDANSRKRARDYRALELTFSSQTLYIIRSTHGHRYGSRYEALVRCLVGEENTSIDRRCVACRHHQITLRKRQRLLEQPNLWLQETIELAGIADGD